MDTLIKPSTVTLTSADVTGVSPILVQMRKAHAQFVQMWAGASPVHCSPDSTNDLFIARLVSSLALP